MTKQLSTLKAVPFLCIIAGIAINTMQNAISSQWRLILSLILMVISIASLVVLKKRSPKNENMKRQVAMLAVFLVLTVAVYLYFLFFKK